MLAGSGQIRRIPLAALTGTAPQDVPYRFPAPPRRAPLRAASGGHHGGMARMSSTPGLEKTAMELGRTEGPRCGSLLRFSIATRVAGIGDSSGESSSFHDGARHKQLTRPHTGEIQRCLRRPPPFLVPYRLSSVSDDLRWPKSCSTRPSDEPSSLPIVGSYVVRT